MSVLKGEPKTCSGSDSVDNASFLKEYTGTSKLTCVGVMTVVGEMLLSRSVSSVEGGEVEKNDRLLKKTGVVGNKANDDADLAEAKQDPNTPLTTTEGVDPNLIDLKVVVGMVAAILFFFYLLLLLLSL